MDLTRTPPAPELKAGALANEAPTRVTEATRVPMGLPNTKLAVPDLPGWFLYWHLGKNVRAAIKAGYQFVSDDELDVEQHNVANDPITSGSTDMGTRVSVAAGSGSTDGIESERLYLMKLPQEWHIKDMATLEGRNEQIARALRAGMIGAEQDPDSGRRYMKAGQDLFFPKNRN